MGQQLTMRRMATVLAAVVLALSSLGVTAASAASGYWSGGGCTVYVEAVEHWGSPKGLVRDHNTACGYLRLEMIWIDGDCTALDTGYLSTNEVSRTKSGDMKRARGRFQGGGSYYTTGWEVQASGC